MKFTLVMSLGALCVQGKVEPPAPVPVFPVLAPPLPSLPLDRDMSLLAGPGALAGSDSCGLYAATTCDDIDRFCPHWAEQGMCSPDLPSIYGLYGQKVRDFMLSNCRAVCCYSTCIKPIFGVMADQQVTAGPGAYLSEVDFVGSPIHLFVTFDSPAEAWEHCGTRHFTPATKISLGLSGTTEVSAFDARGVRGNDVYGYIPEIKYSANPGSMYSILLVDPVCKTPRKEGADFNFQSSSRTGCDKTFDLMMMIINIPGNQVGNGTIAVPYLGPAQAKTGVWSQYTFLLFEQGVEGQAIVLLDEKDHKAFNQRTNFNLGAFVDKYNYFPFISGINWMSSTRQDSWVPKMLSLLNFGDEVCADGCPSTFRTCNNNSHVSCEYWSKAGECRKNPVWMNPNCNRACCTICQSSQVDAEALVKASNYNNAYQDSALLNAAKYDPSVINFVKHLEPGCPVLKRSCSSNSDKACAYWAANGECTKNPFWMHEHCQESCCSACKA